MVFSSSLFLLYFLPVFLVVYYLLPLKLKNYWALLASLFFYAWGAPLFIFIIIASMLLNFFLAFPLSKSSGKSRTSWLAISVVLNLALLLYYKYSNFFVGNVNEILKNSGYSALSWTEIVLPLGISFITFHQLSYMIDVYRDEKPPHKNIASYALYIMYFPRLIAGPIVRHAEIADQISDRRLQENINNRLAGFFRFCIGLAKKVLIANVLGAQADLVFSQNIGDLSSAVAWMGILSYTFQIYFDFSAYSDMAIGLGRMTGFIFPENFNNPYVSASITEFWRRWHMTLSGWLKNYLYMPLAVNLRNRGRFGVFISLMITFTLCGMWHRPGWNFILWGVLQGVLLIADQLFLLKFLKKIGKIPAIMITFLFIVAGWVIFRIENLPDIGLFFGKLFAFDARFCDVIFNAKFWTIFIGAVFFSFFGGIKKIEKWQERIFDPGMSGRLLIPMVCIGLILFTVSLSSITAYGFNPFIYFKF